MYGMLVSLIYKLEPECWEFDTLLCKKKREDSYMPRKAMAHKNKLQPGHRVVSDDIVIIQWSLTETTLTLATATMMKTQVIEDQ